MGIRRLLPALGWVVRVDGRCRYCVVPWRIKATDTGTKVARRQVIAGAVNYHAPTRAHLVRLALDELFARDGVVAATHFADLISTPQIPMATQ
ncbi:hypothetical protein ACWF99_11550 [Nocardia sp. NPDC055002]